LDAWDPYSVQIRDYENIFGGESKSISSMLLNRTPGRRCLRQARLPGWQPATKQTLAGALRFLLRLVLEFFMAFEKKTSAVLRYFGFPFLVQPNGGTILFVPEACVAS
jgi:hypothetical protein